MLDKENQYILENYGQTPVFFSFLPGIAGEYGIPMWCYYMNRGQAISSFGIENKDFSIAEFYPAHQAAQRTPLMGFRTFIKADESFYEMFTKDCCTKMSIGMNCLEISDLWQDKNIEMKVTYTTLTNMPAAALMRKVELINKGSDALRLEVLDGLTELIPYGITSATMKEMGQTAKAWADVSNIRTGMPIFKVRASMQDTADVSTVDGAVFAMAITDKDKEKMPVIADKKIVFGNDTALRFPYGFLEETLDGLLNKEQKLMNDFPCCYFAKQKILRAGETMTFFELYGAAENVGKIDSIQKALSDVWFNEKIEEAKALAQKLTGAIWCHTGNPVFDAYARQTFLDNLLRGGYPKQVDGRETIYIYSRKHGDMERDYNFFSMEPEFFSQGNGNFRDVNQNRRTDAQFFPYVGDMNLKRFYNAIQLNGYNPLGVEKTMYRCNDGNVLTPGAIAERLMETKDGTLCEKDFADALSSCERIDGYSFIEGYWSDHWTYNIDLLESYLKVYPEKKKKVLFEDRFYTFRQAENRLLPRRKRYEKTENGIRQYHFLEKNEKCEKDMPLADLSGNVVYVTLFEKMLSLAVVKMAAIDPYGIGIEMEGGKPGWYDALNGLPGLLGSSVAEAVELSRMLEYMREAADENASVYRLPEEISALAESIFEAAVNDSEALSQDGAVCDFWNAINEAKERFWNQTTAFVSGRYVRLNHESILRWIDCFLNVLSLGRKKSARLSPDVPATYYYYEVTAYDENKEGLLPTAFTIHKTPDFLEGTVHMFKLKDEKNHLKQLYNNIKSSKLYDRKLGMYKVNASLCEASFELGRACAFTPGWLENESIWLHMEYKYLLELLKSGLYEEFFEDWHKAGIPFMDASVYGRSPLENSSFIASSANPDSDIAGRGFVARLSGSTAEFLQMWQLMMFGAAPFKNTSDGLSLSFEPALPSYLLENTTEVSANFLGTTKVVYQLPDGQDLIPGNYHIAGYTLEFACGTEEKVSLIENDSARAVRNGEVSKIIVKICR